MVAGLMLERELRGRGVKGKREEEDEEGDEWKGARPKG